MSNEPAKPKPDEFFLSGSEPTSLVSFLAPMRRGVLVEPLVDGIAAFGSMERAIWNAKSSVDLAFWIFDSDMPLQAAEKSQWGVSKWGELLVARAKAGVNVRLLLTDFDPILGEANHRQNWGAYRAMVLAAVRAGENRDRLQTICSMHPHTAQVTGLSAMAQNYILSQKLDEHLELLNGQLKKDKGNAIALYANWPGLWTFVEFRKKEKVFKRRKETELIIRPAVHHQKLCIVDQATVYLGGLDPAIGRIADTTHSRYIHIWHDIEARLEGPAATDVARSFIGRWNNELELFSAFVMAANATQPPTPLVFHPPTPARLESPRPKPPDAGMPLSTAPGNGIVQIHRTVSEPDKKAVPKVVQKDLRNGWEKAIQQARHFIYLENQYVRSPELAHWIIRQAATSKALRVLIVVPVAPEEVGKSGKGDQVTEHGLALQAEVFKSLRDQLKERVGIFSMLLRKPTRKGTDTGVQQHGSPQIYVHSKILLVDDVYANIASANANPRSFYVDTEIAAAWYEPDEVRKLRLRLWRELLGVDGFEDWKPAEFVPQWKKIAQANAAQKDPTKRTGFIVPHDETKFPGSLSSFVPDEYALFERPQGSPDPELAIA